MKTTNGGSSKERLNYAIEQLQRHNVEFCLKNEKTGHLHCRKKSDDSLVQFWAGTGKIMGHVEKGIHNLIKLLADGAY